MAEVDYRMMTEIANIYMTPLVKQYGDKGINILRVIFGTLQQMYKWIEPLQVKGSIVVFVTIESNVQLINNHEGVLHSDFKNIMQDSLTSLIVQVLENGDFLIWKNLDIDVRQLSENSILYEYHDKIERLISAREESHIPKLIKGRASMFAPPTFSDLTEAISEYREEMVRFSSCYLLKEVWYDNNRIFLKNKPEFIMRNSLTNFLKIRLRGDGVEVRPEQNVDESHPVDIKITWMFSNRLALIEIKWLGKSRNGDGSVSTEYSESRAKTGAKQLAEYLDMNKSQAPQHVTKGLLVVFDARRRNTDQLPSSISRVEGLYYADKEIHFDPCYHDIRADFFLPSRLFIEPICQENQ